MSEYIMTLRTMTTEGERFLLPITHFEQGVGEVKQILSQQAGLVRVRMALIHGRKKRLKKGDKEVVPSTPVEDFEESPPLLDMDFSEQNNVMMDSQDKDSHGIENDLLSKFITMPES